MRNRAKKRRRIEMKRQRKVKPRRMMGSGPRSNHAVRS